MYRSHDGDFYEFLEKPESVIVKCSPMPKNWFYVVTGT
jgi:hypothetical protein